MLWSLLELAPILWSSSDRGSFVSHPRTNGPNFYKGMFSTKGSGSEADFASITFLLSFFPFAIWRLTGVRNRFEK